MNLLTLVISSTKQLRPDSKNVFSASCLFVKFEGLGEGGGEKCSTTEMRLSLALAGRRGVVTLFQPPFFATVNLSQYQR